MDEVKKVIIGKDGCVEKVMAAILAKGNVLLEDVPGVGKTTRWRWHFPGLWGFCATGYSLRRM